MLATVAAIALTQTPLRFADVEKNKYNAFAALTSFSGTYEVVTIPKEGAGLKQSVTMLITADGRLTRIISNGLPQIESSWTKSERWTIWYGERRYSIVESATPLPLTLAYIPLATEAGSINFAMDQSGVRFAADPEPVVVPAVKESLEGKAVRRISCSSKNQATGGEMSLSQWFDGDGWLLRKFELQLKSKGVLVLTVRGTLTGDTTTPTAPANAFHLPDSIKATFTRSGQ